MRSQSIKLAVATLFAAGAMGLSTAASAGIVLNTTGLKADATLTFSVGAFGSATAAGITFNPLGNMTKVKDVVVVDEYGVEDLVPQFNLPVTKADVSVGWDLSIKANSGDSTRSALQMVRGARSAVLANFSLDFKAHVINADFIINGATTKGSVYSFDVIVPEKISFKNLVLNQSVTVGNMILTETAQDTLGDALNLSEPLRATLRTQDWGTISVLVTSYKRSPAVSNKPFTVNDIPTAP